MSRTRITTVLLAMLAGGIVFGPALSSAESGRDLVAYADPGPETTYARHGAGPVVAQAPTPPPKPPKAPKAPTPPTPPTPPPDGPIKIDFNGHHLDLSGIDGMVRGQLDGVREMIRNNSNIPQPLRDKLLARLDKVRASVDKRLAKIKNKRLDEIGGELERLTDDIEQALDGLDEELEQLGDQIGKNLSKKFKDKKWKFDFKKNDHENHFGNEDGEENEDDQDVPDSIPMAPDLDSADDGDMRDAINDLKGMAIRKDQKDQIVQIRAKADAEVKVAREIIETTSKKLETALGNPNSSDAEIGRMVDQISGAEARIRKARIIAWHSARRVLDDGQRKRIEAAAAKKKGN